jgi:hypothetical protein
MLVDDKYVDKGRSFLVFRITPGCWGELDFAAQIVRRLRRRAGSSMDAMSGSPRLFARLRAAAVV